MLQQQLETLVDTYTELLQRHQQEQSSISQIDDIIKQSKSVIEDIKGSSVDDHHAKEQGHMATQTGPELPENINESEIDKKHVLQQQEEIERLEALLKCKQEECNGLIREHQQKQEQELTKLKKSHQQQTELQAKLQELNKEIENLKKVDIESRKIMANHDLILKNKEQQLKESTHTLSSLKIDNDKSAAEHKSIIAKLEKHNSELKQKNDTLSQREKEIQLDLNKSYQQNAKLTSEISEIQKKYNSLEFSVKKIKQQLESSNDDCAQLKKSLEEQQVSLRQAKVELSEKQQCITNMNERAKVANANHVLVEQQLKEEVRATRRLKVILSLGIMLLFQYVASKRLQSFYLEDIVLT